MSGRASGWKTSAPGASALTQISTRPLLPEAAAASKQFAHGQSTLTHSFAQGPSPPALRGPAKGVCLCVCVCRGGWSLSVSQKVAVK